MYGYRAKIASNYLRNWSKHVHNNVRHWEREPERCVQSVTRSFEDYHKTANLLREEIGVAKKDFSNSTFKGFINVPLSPEQKEAFGDWDIQDADVWDGLATYGEKGYKFSLSHNKSNESWIATFTAGEDTGKNSGYCVSGFASDPYNAARVLLFKVSAILPDVWKDFKPLPSDTIG